MAVNSLPVETSQQKKYDTNEEKRRFIFEKPVKVCLETTLDKILSPVPEQFRVLVTKPYARNYFDMLVRKNTFSFISKIDGKKMKVVDIAEAQWFSQTTLAERWGVSVETIKQVERALKKAGVLEVRTNGKRGHACRRYYAFSEIFQAWLKVGQTVFAPKPSQKDGSSQNPCQKNGYGEYPNMGTESTQNPPTLGTESTPTIKNMTIENNYDDAAPTKPNPATINVAHLSPSSLNSKNTYKNQEDRKAIWALVDGLNVDGFKDTKNLNKMFIELKSEYGLEKCQRFVRSAEQTRFKSEGQLATIREAFLTQGNPEVAEQIRLAKEAKGAAIRERNLQQAMPLAYQVQDKQPTDHNQKTLVDKMAGFAPDNAKNIQRRKRLAERKGGKL